MWQNKESSLDTEYNRGSYGCSKCGIAIYKRFLSELKNIKCDIIKEHSLDT